MTDERKAELIALRKDIETAIQSLVKNKVKSYRIGDRYYTYFDLKELGDMRREINKELNDTVKVVRVLPF